MKLYAKTADFSFAFPFVLLVYVGIIYVAEHKDSWF